MSSNKISLSGKLIHKCYQSRLARDRELLFLTLCSGTGLTPEVTAMGENSLTLTVVKGPVLLDVLEEVWAGRALPEAGQALLGLLADWLLKVQRHFQSQTGKTAALDDPNLRNFIVTSYDGVTTSPCMEETGANGLAYCGSGASMTIEDGRGLAGLDFEYWHYGSAEYTPAMMLAYLASYRGAETSVARRLREWFRSELIVRLSLREDVLFREEEHCRNVLALRRATAGARRASTAVILAGGRSERMGRPKAALEDGGYTFLERTIYAFTSFNHIAVSVGETACETGGLPVWQDIRPGVGPMSGLLTALSRAQTPLVFLTACDTPGITEELIFHLYDALVPEDECLIPVADGRIHPLAGIYRTTLLPRVEALMEAGNYRLRSLLDSAAVHYYTLDAHFSAQLGNINTPRDYADYLHMRNGGMHERSFIDYDERSDRK